MFTRHENKRKYFRGRGRRKHRFSQGRNHENFKEERKDGETSHKSYKRNNFKKSSSDTSKLQCYKCKKIGHIAPNCPQRTKPNEQSNLVEEDLELTLLMSILKDEKQRLATIKKTITQDIKWVNFLKSKDQAFDTFKEYKKSIENELRTTLKMLRTDRGGEFTSNEFTQYCKENGIARQLTAPYSPQQNGVVERRNRTIMSTTRCMMKATNMPQNFWAEAVRHAIYILNSVPTKALEDITPYEAIKRRKPNLENLRVVLQHTYAKICVSRDVKFKENETWDWKEYMSEHINDEPEWTDFKIGNLEVTNEHHDQGTQQIEEDNEFPNNDDDDYASPTRDSPSHSQTPHTPSTSSSQVNSQVTPNISTQSNYQSDNDSIQITNSPSQLL
ncbi:zinc finger, CCHC-type containing protein [Tanacetum coccineum]